MYVKRRGDSLRVSFPGGYKLSCFGRCNFGGAEEDGFALELKAAGSVFAAFAFYVQFGDFKAAIFIEQLNIGKIRR